MISELCIVISMVYDIITISILYEIAAEDTNERNMKLTYMPCPRINNSYELTMRAGYP